MIDGVHYHAAHMRSSTSPASAPRFAARNVHMINVANLANGREAVLMNPANFPRRHFHERVPGFQCSKRRLLSGAARDLTATSRSQFNVVNICAERNGMKRERIPQVRSNVISGLNGRSDLKSIRRENVT